MEDLEKRELDICEKTKHVINMIRIVRYEIDYFKMLQKLEELKKELEELKSK